MKPISILLIALPFTVLCCSAPRYVPEVEDVGSSPYGSYIEVYSNRPYVVSGELISLQNDHLYVLLEDEVYLDSIHLDEVSRFTLTWAQPKNYGWSIPLFTLTSISGGGFAIFTAPISWMITIGATSTGARDFQHNGKSIQVADLHLFARFPQGIPSGLPHNSILPARD